MAVTTTNPEVTVSWWFKDIFSSQCNTISLHHFHSQVIGVKQIESNQKRRRRNNKKKSDDSTCTSQSSDSSTTCKPRRRRRRSKGNKNGPLQRTNDEVHLSLQEQTNYVALDCEMVGVGYQGRKSSVARVTMIGWNGEIIYDKFVKQETQVTDYRTFISGISESDLSNAELTLGECRREVLQLLEGKILVGHALKMTWKL